MTRTEDLNLRRLAEAARDSLARDGTSWWDAMRYIASDEEQDFATLCSPDRILALLAEVDRLTAKVVVEVQEVADTIPIACRAAVKNERALIAEAVGRLPNWNALRLELPGDIVDHVRAAVLAAIGADR